MLQYIVILGAIAQLFGTYFYIRDTVSGEIKPNKVSWLLWAAAPLIGSAAAFADGVRWAALPVFMNGFGPLLIFIASFVNPKSFWKLEKFDYICGSLSVLALVLWGITKEPLVAIVFAIFSDIFASVPTLIKSWKFPETESILPYVTFLFNSITSFFALRIFSIVELAFPSYLVVINASLAFAVHRGRLKKVDYN